MSVARWLRLSAGLLLLAGSFLFCSATIGDDKAEKPKPPDKAKEIAGTSEFLRSVPKHFAILKGINVAKRQVTLQVEGENLAKVWQLTPDAELKIAGWWARLDGFTVGDRVWAWFETNRDKQPVAIFMLCDELSEQDMHGPGIVIQSIDDKSIAVKPVKGDSRQLQMAKA